MFFLVGWGSLVTSQGEQNASIARCKVMAEDFQSDVSSRYSSILSLSYSSSSFDMIKSSDPATCAESDLEEGSENIVVPYKYEPEESGSESESSDESQNDGRLQNTEWLVSCVC